MPSEQQKLIIPLRPIPAGPALVFSILALILLGMGRTLWCSCGSFIPWSWQVFSQHNSQHLIDWYSFSHVIHGFIFYWLATLIFPGKTLQFRLLAAMLVESGWEIAENSPFIIDRYRTATMAFDYYGDSVANSLSDLAMATFGFILAARLPARVTIALAVAAELFTLAMIRDNLTLNVIMLIWPIDAIKQWQGG